MHHHDDEDSKGPQVQKWLIAISLVVLFYLASVPPVNIAFYRYGPRPVPEWVVVFGQPFYWLAENTPLEKPLKGYGIWWAKIILD
jgi:hypothetical protein